MDMRRIFDYFASEIDGGKIKKRIEALRNAEMGQTSENWMESASLAASFLREDGFRDVEMLEFPADGKTVYDDKCMPLAWRVSKGRLTILNSVVPFADPVLADYGRHPFHLIKGSTATPQGGLVCSVVSEAAMLAGDDVKGAMIICAPDTPPRSEILRMALDLGAIGIISSWLKERHYSPNGLQWVNACTEGGHWHVQADDRDFIGFSVTPLVGDAIRNAVSKGTMKVRVECDGERYAGVLPAVTATLPGRRKEEMWVTAHLYEPMADDNSSGVVAAVSILAVIRDAVAKGVLPPLEFTIRVVFALEFYGFAAFAWRMGFPLTDRVVGSLNIDGGAVSPDHSLRMMLAPPGMPFFGNSIMESIPSICCGAKYFPKVEEIAEQGAYADDLFMSEPAAGIPTMWMFGVKKIQFWHNSEQDMRIIDPGSICGFASMLAAWLATSCTLNSGSIEPFIRRAAILAQSHLERESERIDDALKSGKYRESSNLADYIARRMAYRLEIDSKRIRNFDRAAASPVTEEECAKLAEYCKSLCSSLLSKISSAAAPEFKNCKWLDYASGIVPKRGRHTFPYDQKDIPIRRRRELPDTMIYGAFSRIYANIDGKKDLRQLICEAEWEENRVFTSVQIRKYVLGIMNLGDRGFISAKSSVSISGTDIKEALGRLAVCPGDLLFVHSSESACGHVIGGAKTVIDAISEAVGKEGTVLYPTFTRPYICFEGSVNKSMTYRPFDPADPELISTGEIPKEFLRSGKVQFRSAHITHSWSGSGRLAGECTRYHGAYDSPVTPLISPVAKGVEYKGKILFFGCTPASSTIIHLLEEEADLPYLRSALCRVRCPDGFAVNVFFPKHLPGCREFYTPDGLNSKFYRRAVERGLKINTTNLGVGTLYMIDAAEIHRIGMALIREDLNILLCDSKECSFCGKYRK